MPASEAEVYVLPFAHWPADRLLALPGPFYVTLPFYIPSSSLCHFVRQHPSKVV